MRDRPLVERVDLQLDPVETEIDEHVALERARRLVPDPPAATAGMDREAPDLRDPMTLVLDCEADRSDRLAVLLYDEPAIGGGLPLGACNLRKHVVARL